MALTVTATATATAIATSWFQYRWNTNLSLQVQAGKGKQSQRLRLGIKCSASSAMALPPSSSSSSGFDLRSYWSGLIEEINQKLDESIPVSSPYTERIYKAMRYSVLAKGAKRAPPVMCITACELFGGHRLAAFPTACALEMRSLYSIHELGYYGNSLSALPGKDKVCVHHTPLDSTCGTSLGRLLLLFLPA